MSNPLQCPVCERTAILPASPLPSDVWTGTLFFSVLCDECGEFRIEDGFLAHGWSEVPSEDKKAIAAYLKETKGKSSSVRDIDSNSWRHFVIQGKKFLKNAETP